MGGVAVSPPRRVWVGPGPPVSVGPVAGGPVAGGTTAGVVAGVVVTAVDVVVDGLVVVGCVPLPLLHAAASGLTAKAADIPAAASHRRLIGLSEVMSATPFSPMRGGPVGYPFARAANLPLNDRGRPACRGAASCELLT
jgi:hypothetical protein